MLIVIRISGSYLRRAAIEFLRHNFYNSVSKIRKTPEIYYAGNSISSTYLKHSLDVVGDRDSVNIIQIRNNYEPAIAFVSLKRNWKKIW